ncbi:hypothetical protein HBH56_071890 [Parastagonospora nodorum]|uniref:Uncharacterized protein n=2 Tax=Phaeosphaeria nodorum (strain SN15 / ATCC MYA-4574 / FGSC 10173) TaxID=321614 RepID=A0A7U2NQE8_PHANO|nr:hypothetical protein SNOG_13486 [Parastagonospora nodorum SN15]KAH3915274.1 hypothetical protein HBH56_071890 [Parastagonospora nodorum]EAT78933.1 hypothetical protein SNOG_13486 [Parastagonospora nodorum SN15]KAH3927424.1 hypothetical protein HBH54_152120 [Parastagonospora nodorum]KAH3951854.1 hypothetical protein HBH53_056240 [Parastagonospora nodorum]KAH3982918.1 hypothetical protein HBH52_066480 [Parastagonospora nodorum]
MVSFTTLALLATSAIAGPVVRDIAIPKNWHWKVENCEAGCGRRGCYYYFNVTVPSVENGPAGVKALCNVYEQGYENSFTVPSTYTDCRLLEGVNNGVAARPSLRTSDGNGSPKEIEVSFLYAGYGDRPAYNFSGSHKVTYNQFVSPPLNFTITPKKVFGVA